MDTRSIVNMRSPNISRRWRYHAARGVERRYFLRRWRYHAAQGVWCRRLFTDAGCTGDFVSISVTYFDSIVVTSDAWWRRDNLVFSRNGYP